MLFLPGSWRPQRWRPPSRILVGAAAWSFEASTSCEKILLVGSHKFLLQIYLVIVDSPPQLSPVQMSFGIFSFYDPLVLFYFLYCAVSQSQPSWITSLFPSFELQQAALKCSEDRSLYHSFACKTTSLDRLYVLCIRLEGIVFLFHWGGLQRTFARFCFNVVERFAPHSHKFIQ